MNTKYTPTPFRPNGDSIMGKHPGQQHDVFVASITFGDLEQRSANRDFIIRACNSHAEMLAALEQITNCAVWAAQVIKDIPETSHYRQCINEARAAIAKAGGAS